MTDTLTVTVREWTEPNGRRISFRREDAAANVGRKILVVARPGSWRDLPDGIGTIVKAVADGGNLVVELALTHGSEVPEHLRERLTDPRTGAGAGMTVTTGSYVGGIYRASVKQLREVYPLPPEPAVERKCSPDCPHHKYPNLKAACDRVRPEPPAPITLETEDA